jgi:hypothetical protein
MPKTPDPAEVKKQLEALAGQELDITPELAVVLTFPIGAHDITNGIVASRTILSKSCTSSSLLDASGATFTGPAGNVTFVLSNVICLPPGFLTEPINLLATAHSSNTPFYVTTFHTLLGNDVEITLFAWDPKGNPAPKVQVHWRCRVVWNPIIG